MKIKIRPDDVGTPDENEWTEMNGWLAELREDSPEDQVDSRQRGPVDGPQGDPADSPQGDPADSPQGDPADSPQGDPADSPQRGPVDGPQADPVDGPQADPADSPQGGPVNDRRGDRASNSLVRPARDGYAAPPRDSRPRPASDNRARPASESHARPARHGYAAPRTAPVRAVIGDELRIPMVWCEMGSCISWHADRTALGQADVRGRAIRAGWRIDALGRLACPQCQQTDVAFRATRPVVLWDRSTAIAMAARATTPDSRSARAARAATPDRRPARAARPGSWAARGPAVPPSRRPAVPAAGPYGQNPRHSAAGPR